MIGALSLLGPALGSSVMAPSTQDVEKGIAASAAGRDFVQVLADVSADAVNALKAGEAASISGLHGKASVQQVVEAVMSAEQSLHTVVAIRDKVVGAYQSLSQMAI
jgi:flagellar hook-basal body complex protein FliE